MRKLWIIAAFAAIALTSCQQEKEIQEGSFRGENNVSFVLQNGVSTRSGGTVSLVERGAIIPVATIGNQKIFLEETIQDLNACGAETRGTPVYTENLGYLFRDKLGVHTSTYNTNVVYQQYGDTMIEDADGKYWCYGYEYPTNIWGNQETAVHFALYMPFDMTSNGVTPTFDGPNTTVAYVSPTTAEDTQDIVFGGVTKTFKQYHSDYAKFGGTKVTLYHALTGVKFAIANNAGELDNLHIDRITFTGLKNTGTFTFTASTEKIEWTDSLATGDSVISQEFGENDLVTYSSTAHADQHFAPSFFNGGVKQNLNDDNATKTFWLVPQNISENSTATMLIEYTINGTESWMEIGLNELKAQDWEPGQLRTFTFKVDDVNLKIEDDVVVPATANATNAFADSYKENVEITNTGNTLAFIRAALVGQWMHEEDVDEDGVVETNPIFGFTDNVNNLYVVDSWYEDQFMNTGDPVHGEFEGLPGYHGDPNPNANGWVLCTDGYYYYTKAVPPYDSEKTKEQNKTAGAICKPLFTKYTVLLKPQATSIAGEVLSATSMHFELEIAAQAISAVQRDGTVKKDSNDNDDWAAAWEEVLESKPVKKQ